MLALVAAGVLAAAAGAATAALGGKREQRAQLGGKGPA